MTAKIGFTIPHTARRWLNRASLCAVCSAIGGNVSDRYIRLLEADEQAIPAMVKAMYKGLDPRLTGAQQAGQCSRIFVDLRNRGVVVEGGDGWKMSG